ncbi:MAG: ECF transporter S component [Bacteroidales bacterium]|nr:ECF transporter S component [Bacteroidales bacterium]
MQQTLRIFPKFPSSINRFINNKYLGAAGIVLLLILLNRFLQLNFPGISNADLRPQIVLICLAGYFYGPVIGFLIGLIGNTCSDLLLGYGFNYLLSWSVGNGIMGMIMGFCKNRKLIKLDKISQLLTLTLMIIVANIAFVLYASSVYSLLNKSLTIDVNLKFYLFPVLNSNMIASLLLFPAILLFLGKFRMNLPIKIALSTFYSIALLLHIVWFVNRASFDITGFLSLSNSDITGGNRYVEAFNVWSTMLICFLLAGYLFAMFISGKITRPIVELDHTVRDLLQSDVIISESFEKLTKREDEVGLLSYTIRLLGEKLWDNQSRFITDFAKKMKFITPDDNPSDILLVGLVTIFGKQFNLQDYDLINSSDNVSTGDISHIQSIELLVKLAGLKELAYTYSTDKLNTSLSDLMIDPELTTEQLQYLAVAIDIGLVFRGKTKFLDLSQPITREFALHLLYRTSLFISGEKTFIGYITEPDIMARIEGHWKTAKSIPDNGTSGFMNDLVRKKMISGYNIRFTDDRSNFDRNLKLTYTHSDFRHIKQLVGLIRSENIQVKINIEHKRSTFLYYNEWGTNNRLYLDPIDEKLSWASVDEKDLALEFTTSEKRTQFLLLINDFAKKEASADKKLIAQSWYRPLIISEAPLSSFNRINEITIQPLNMTILTLVTEKSLCKTLNALQECFDPTLINTRPVWVNDDFYTYLYKETDWI